MTMQPVIEAIAAEFNAIGTEVKPETVVDAGRSNSADAAAEYMLARILMDQAKARLDAATKQALERGILGNEAEIAEGNTVMTFNCPNFTINLKKGRSSQILDKDMVKDNAVKHFGEKRANELLAESLKPRKATVQIFCAVKG